MNDKRWKWGLLAACVVVFVTVVSALFDNFGLGGKPWFGYWDDIMASTDRPFVGQTTQVVAGGAAARAGIRDGDRVDLREQGLYDRTSLVFQPVTSKTATVVVHRGGKTLHRSRPSQHDISRRCRDQNTEHRARDARVFARISVRLRHRIAPVADARGPLPLPDAARHFLRKRLAR